MVAVKNESRNHKLVVSYKSPSTLKADPKNPRTHTDKQIRQIAHSVEAFGFNVPVLVDSDSNVIAGHGRVHAAHFLKLKKVPTIRLDHLSAEQRRAFMIADNRLCENAAWDDRLLGEQLKFLSEAEINFDLHVTGFEVAEIDLYIDGLSTAPEDEVESADDFPRKLDAKPVSNPGDLFCLGKHRVYCADALMTASYLALMDAKKANAVIADPPYNVRIEGHASGLGKVRHKDFAMACGEMSPEQFTKFLTQAMKVAVANTTNGSIHFWTIDWRHIAEMLAAGGPTYSELKGLCVW